MKKTTAIYIDNEKISRQELGILFAKYPADKLKLAAGILGYNSRKDIKLKDIRMIEKIVERI